MFSDEICKMLESIPVPEFKTPKKHIPILSDSMFNSTSQNHKSVMPTPFVKSKFADDVESVQDELFYGNICFL